MRMLRHAAIVLVGAYLFVQVDRIFDPGPYLNALLFSVVGTAIAVLVLPDAGGLRDPRRRRSRHPA
jgi:hypothetical protein